MNCSENAADNFPEQVKDKGLMWWLNLLSYATQGAGVC